MTYSSKAARRRAGGANRTSQNLDPFQAQHAALSEAFVDLPSGRSAVLINENESPLVWLARRKGKTGCPLLATHHLQAGERLRADFTRAHLMPRTTSNWDMSASRGRGTYGGEAFAEGAIAARQRVRHALEKVGPEFSGLLLDVCCFLKGLEEIEREHIWPRSSARVVLQLGLERLARHYGYGAQAAGRPQADMCSWLAEDASFTTDVAD